MPGLSRMTKKRRKTTNNLLRLEKKAGMYYSCMVNSTVACRFCCRKW